MSKKDVKDVTQLCPPPLCPSTLWGVVAPFCRKDRAMAAWIERDLAVGGDWNLAVAAGRTLRLFNPPEKSVRVLFEQLLQGNPPPPDPAFLWAKGWSRPQTEKLESLCWIKAQKLRERILGDEEGKQGPLSPEEAREILLVREEIACVLPLLRLHAPLPLTETVAEALGLLDEDGLHAVKTWPKESLFLASFHSILRRVETHAEPGAWWAWPCRNISLS